MFPYNLFTFTLLALTAAAASAQVLPVDGGVPYSVSAARFRTSSSNQAETDVATIDTTIIAVEQKAGAPTDAPPGLPPVDTVVTAVDGALTDAGTNSTAARKRSLYPASPGRFVRSAAGKYTQVFSGTGTNRNNRDCSIEGTSYLTYTLVSNSTYSVAECLSFCDRVEGCTFANLYYEYNNPLLDWVFSEKSNLKCAVYGDRHEKDEKLNCGGQQLAPEGWGKTFIQHSSGWALDKYPVPVPRDVDGYDLVYGPHDGANNAPGYMGFVLLSSYDPRACALECNKRGPDLEGGACQYFNIWRAVVKGIPTTYTCAMYYIPADQSTAVNYGQGDLKVTHSRGYRRRSHVPDGGFEGYKCSPGQDPTFCFTDKYEHWTGITPKGGKLDAAIFHYDEYAHSGTGVGMLGSGFGTDNLAGTLTPAKPLRQTKRGKEYSIHFFHNSAFSDPQSQKDSFVEVIWNGKVVETIRPGFEDWTYYEFQVRAKGNDVLAFRGGKAPAYSFIDDVYVFAA